VVDAPPELTIASGKLTYEDLVSLPDDGKRYEILDGDLVMTPSPSTRHQRVSRNLGHILHLYVTEHGGGELFYAPLDVILDRYTIVEPDIVYVSADRSSIVQEHAIVGAPDLLIEILSPLTADRDRGAKAKLYAKFGVDCYWIVDPKARTLDAFSRGGERYGAAVRYSGDAVVRTSLFPQLTIELKNVWA
jgi:Uma2 family endonuclease